MSNRIEKQILLKAPVSKVWQALVNHKEFGLWFRVKIENPFVVGQVSSGMITYPGYEHYPWEARILKMDKDKYFAFEWPHMDENGKVDISKDLNTLVEFKLEAQDGNTLLTIVESGFEKLPEAIRLTNMRSNEGGWEEQTKNIEAYLAEKSK